MMSEIFGYIFSLLIGISIGLIGAGGSILSMPIIVYLFGIHPVLATTYSLFVVSSTSAVGSVPYILRKQYSLNAILAFGIPSIVAIVITRKWLLPLLPKVVFTIGDKDITDGKFLMTVFALIMIFAAYRMIRGAADVEVFQEKKLTVSTILQLSLLGLMVGLLAGLVGAGGGFMIIPALVLVYRLPMKYAVGTSLIIITVNSLFGFLSFPASEAINWTLLLSIVGIAIVGIFIGTSLSKRINGQKLKKGFGYFVLIMGFYILLREWVIEVS